MKETTHAEETRAANPPGASETNGASEANNATRRKLFVMRAGARLFAVYADEVETTCENLTPTPLPFAPAPVRGVVSRRGRIYTLIDPLPLLPGATQAQTLAPQPASQISAPPTDAQTLAPPTRQWRAPFVVALKGDEQLALAVESIEHEVELYDDAANDAADGATHNEASDKVDNKASVASAVAASDTAATQAATDASNSSLLLVRRTIPCGAHHVALLDPARLFEAAMRGVERRRQRT